MIHMVEITVRLPDGSEKQVPEGATILDVAGAIGPRLAQAALAGKIDGAMVDVNHVVADGAAVEIITDRSPEALHILRHSTAHVLAEAVASLFPMTKFGIGPSIEDGFYYDFDVERPFTPEDLSAIEERMSEIVAEELPFDRGELDKLEAWDAFDGQPYKRELIEDLPEGEIISIYNQGNFTDLCRGPHVPHTGRIGAFKLMKVAGAYWRGDSDRTMLQRIYGTAWFNKKDLEAHLTRIEEAERRDHRKLGKELDLFSFHEIAGAGLPLYHPTGARVLRLLQEWLRDVLYKRGYVEAITPHIYKADVWKISGHYDFYKENMYFFEIDEGDGKVNEYAVKPMNCPGHVMIYDNDVRSYRDLPMRMFEFGTVYRHEMSGVVHGLLRARGFTQDDAHIFCMEDQVQSEVVKMLELVEYVFTEVFDFTYTAEISTRPEKSIGEDAMWDLATDSLKAACAERGLDYEINEGDGAFYGPKIDI
jgi:threonyl-tRNA synthetase